MPHRPALGTGGGGRGAGGRAGGGGPGGRSGGAGKAGKGANGPRRRRCAAAGRERRRALSIPASAAPSALPLPSPGHEYVTPLSFPNSIAEAAARHIVLPGLRLHRRRERAAGASGAARRPEAGARRAVSAGRRVGAGAGAAAAAVTAAGSLPLAGQGRVRSCRLRWGAAEGRAALPDPGARGRRSWGCASPGSGYGGEGLSRGGLTSGLRRLSGEPGFPGSGWAVRCPPRRQAAPLAPRPLTGSPRRAGAARPPLTGTARCGGWWGRGSCSDPVCFPHHPAAFGVAAGPQGSPQA